MNVTNPLLEEVVRNHKVAADTALLLDHLLVAFGKRILTLFQGATTEVVFAYPSTLRPQWHALVALLTYIKQLVLIPSAYSSKSQQLGKALKPLSN